MSRPELEADMLADLSSEVVRLTEELARLRDAIAFGAPRNLTIREKSVLLTAERSGDSLRVIRREHDGTAADLERAVLEAVDAARKGAT